MTDEWSEFLAYTHFPEYKSDKSTDTTTEFTITAYEINTQGN